MHNIFVYIYVIQYEVSIHVYMCNTQNRAIVISITSNIYDVFCWEYSKSSMSTVVKCIIHYFNLESIYCATEHHSLFLPCECNFLSYDQPFPIPLLTLPLSVTNTALISISGDHFFYISQGKPAGNFLFCKVAQKDKWQLIFMENNWWGRIDLHFLVLFFALLKNFEFWITWKKPTGTVWSCMWFNPICETSQSMFYKSLRMPWQSLPFTLERILPVAASWGHWIIYTFPTLFCVSTSWCKIQMSTDFTRSLHFCIFIVLWKYVCITQNTKKNQRSNCNMQIMEVAGIC
jgi:hypothetical protein